MRSFLENRRLILVFSILTLSALTVLAIGLGNVPFRDAQRFGSVIERGNLGIDTQSLLTSFAEIPIWQSVVMWLLLLIMIVLVSVLLSPELRKALIRSIIRVAVTYWAFYIVATRYREALAQMMSDGQALSGSIPYTFGGTPPPAFVPPQTISLTSYLVSFGIAVLLVLFAWKMFKVWQEHNAVNANLPLNKIAGIARSSLNDLTSGRNSTDVIMNCYFRMSDVVENKRNLSRSKSMTPAEFATRLEQGGLPSDAVQRLTRLFERVRYGGHRSGTSDVNEAVACLTTILNHCGEAV
ncbi:MAG TPA: DUF4129 domain-containing protein [Anaerolineales bacterium]|nr:DUF4129 domain-containing protein [Anaerolineales bacterium]